MSYLQRLLDAAPSVLSMTPGNAAPSPVFAHDQRLGQFPDLLDQPLPTQQAEASPPPSPPVEVNRMSPPPAAELAPTVAAAPLPFPDSDVITLPRNGATPAPPPAEAWATAPATDRPADPAAPRSEAMAGMPVVQSSRTLSHPEEPTPFARPLFAVTEAAAPGLASHLLPISASPIPVPAWPIADADFRPLEDASTRSDPEDPRGLPQTLPPAPATARPLAPVTPSPGARPGEHQSAPAPVVTLEAPADIAPSPLAGVPQAASPAPQPAPAAARSTEQRDAQTVERRVEQLPTPVSTTLPMTAAEVSVIGPIRIGSPGLREIRARGWA